MPIADVNRHRLYYEDTGDGAPAIVFSHGFALDHSLWDAQVAALAADFRCLAHDERGHGMSELHGPYDFDDLADDVMGLLDAAGVERAILVGHSQGGWLSMSAALRHPERVAGLVLVATASDLDPEEVRAGYRSWGANWVENGPVGETAESMLVSQFGPAAPEHAAVWTAKWQARPPSAYRQLWESVVDARDDLVPRLGDIACPALVVHGTADESFSMDRARLTAAGLADCRGLVEVEGGPHSMSITHADEVTAAIRGFAESLG